MKRRFRVLVLVLAAALLSLPAVPAGAASPVLTLSMDRSVYTASQTATFRSHVEAMNLTYVLQIQYPGSSEWKTLCSSVNVNTADFKCQLGLQYNMKVRALLLDTKGTPDDTSDDTVEALVARAVPVRSSVGTVPSGFYSRSGKYRVMGRSAAKFVSQSSPAFPGQRCIRHQVQRKKASGWRTVKTGKCVVQGKQGLVRWTWKGRHPTGVKYRVRASVAEDQVNKAGVGRWVYVRFR
ncbi:hypothetical protein ABIE44_002597 [Marmoricola sp. OAE513]|uniref:hypothetical protein n=1 Tax=Marmoricola sp. OAE513 TaxID=2817894 RepID=UPI001AEAB0A8